MAESAAFFYAPRLVRAFLFLIALAPLAMTPGCSPRIGDGCSNPGNCSINGDRACDIAQPGGYCTVIDCLPDRCPDEAVCVRFNPQPARRATVACMRACSSDGDCRSEYQCLSIEDLTAAGLDAEITDTRRGPRFCVARISTSAALESAMPFEMTEHPDGG